MILHLFVGDLYVERLPPDVKFLKIHVRADRCREHAVASDLYLSDNIVRFNQTMHFPVGEEENIINELDISLICLKNDSTEATIGSCRFICTSGEHSITKAVTLNDHRGVLVGKVPITTFYYSSAIKLGDRVMFKPMYEPNAKEYAFLLSRRIRHSSKASPVTFDHNVEHQLNNDARDLINNDFTIVSAKALNKKKPPATAPKAAKIASSAPDSLTYNPGMTRGGTMSDAVRGRLHSKPAIPRKTGTSTAASTAAAKAAKAHPSAPPKLRSTYMSVGYVKEKQWPERDTGEAERNLFRLHQASEMKLQLLKDISYLAQQRNARTQAKQDAIRRQKQRVDLQEGKIKRVLARKESEIQLLKGTLTHLRLTSALRSANSGATSSAGNAHAHAATKQSVPAFSRLQHLLYPNENDSTRRRASTPNLTSRSLPSTTAANIASSQKRPSSAPRSSAPRSSVRSATPRGRSGSVKKAGVSFSLTQPTTASAPPAPLYHPLSSGPSPYDSRRRPVSAGRAPPRRAVATQEELVDQLSEAFDISFDDDHYSEANSDNVVDYRNERREQQQASAGVDHSTSIAKDWLATARASINEHHRHTGQDSRHEATARVRAPQGSPRSPGVSKKSLQSPRQSVPEPRQQNSNKRAPNTTAAARASPQNKVHHIPVVRPQAPAAHYGSHQSTPHGAPAIPVPAGSCPHYPEDDVSESSDESEQQHRVAQRAQERASAVPGFLNSLVQAPTALNVDFDTTVSSIAVGDIPYFPTGRIASHFAHEERDQHLWAERNNATEQQGEASPTRSEHSTDSLDYRKAAPAETVQTQDAAAATTSRRHAAEENIVNLAHVGVLSSTAAARAPVSNRVNQQLERNQRYTALLQAQQQSGSAQNAPPPSAQQQQKVQTLAQQALRAAPPFAPSTTKPALSSASVHAGSLAHRQPPQAVPPTRSASAGAPAAHGVASAGSATAARAQPFSAVASAAVAASAPAPPVTAPEGAVEVDESGDESFEDAQEYSLSATLAQNVAEVANTVQQLQSRVSSLHQKTQEDLVPPGWTRRSSSTATTSAVAGTTEGAVRMAPEDAPLLPRSARDTGNDIKIVFDEASSSSGEFDVMAYKTAVARK